MPRALDGIRVVDFGQYIAGPLLGMILADQGAEVIHVDPPTGPFWNTPANQTWHRNGVPQREAGVAERESAETS